MFTSDRLAPTLRDRLRHLLGSRGWPRALALRRLLAAALVLLAAALALKGNPGRGAPTSALLIATHDLASGITLTPADVRVVPVPDDLRPASALTSVAEAVGRVLAGAAGAGEPVTSARLVGPENTRLVADGGAVAVPVRLADPAVADLLGPGARVDLVTADPHGGAGVLLAADATVVTVRAAEAPGGRPGRLVVIAMPRDTATRAAAVSLGQPVTVTLR